MEVIIGMQNYFYNVLIEPCLRLVLDMFNYIITFTVYKIGLAFTTSIRIKTIHCKYMYICMYMEKGIHMSNYCNKRCTLRAL